MNALSLLKDFERSFIGFDKVFNEFANAHSNFAKTLPSFPPYNIKKIDDKTFTIELAVAGFSRQDIDVELDGDTLKISGRTNSDDSEYIYKGIAERAFARQWKIADSIEIKNASLINGMLKITLENMMKVLPAKKIEIEAPEEEATTKKPLKKTQQLLTESER